MTGSEEKALSIQKKKNKQKLKGLLLMFISFTSIKMGQILNLVKCARSKYPISATKNIISGKWVSDLQKYLRNTLNDTKILS